MNDKISNTNSGLSNTEKREAFFIGFRERLFLGAIFAVVFLIVFKLLL